MTDQRARLRIPAPAAALGRALSLALSLAPAFAHLAAAPAAAQTGIPSIDELLPERTFVVPSVGMRPMIAEGDYIRVDQRSAAKASIARGDVVVFKDPQGVYFVKRVIGLPGETVAFEGGAPIVDGARLSQREIGPYADAPADWPHALTEIEETGPEGAQWRVLDSARATPMDDVAAMRVPEGAYYLVGDFRDNSLDSRHGEVLGPISAETIIGVVVDVRPGRDAAQ